ncbi:MAG: filamentous hemagglutinin N-terminal domain-containing protein, partial [Phycisphaerales bacterium]|nr:filamentous hemagglutinin N-terminal domain-containing protein [Phycisphaerales bacterium]
MKKMQFRTVMSRVHQTIVATVISAGLGAVAPSALASPVVDQWITQEGVVSQIGSVTNVFLPNTATNRHIIQWISMNIGSGETMNFNGANGYAVLNQIRSGMGRTEILGTLNAVQGNVYFVNQAGVAFGAGSIVNARGITAAAASFSETGGLDTPMRQAFMNNDAMVFNLVDTVTVEGAIDGGPGAAILNATEGLALLGTNVSNGGHLQGRTVVLAIGDQVIIDNLDDPLSVIIDGKTLEDLAASPNQTVAGATGEAGIHNTGTIEALDGGSVALAASDLVGMALAIHHEGEIIAAAGTVDLLAGAGAVWTAPDTGAGGGLSHGVIDVSHADGAGAIRMVASAILHEGVARAEGGDGAVVLHAADNVVLIEGGSIDVDGGLQSGDAGTIDLIADHGTVWGEQGTALSAKGGLLGGDGGAITISADSVNVLSAGKVNSNNGAHGGVYISSVKDAKVDGSGALLGDLDVSDLSSALVADGDLGRIGAATGELLWYLNGDVTVESDGMLRLEQSLINELQADRDWGFIGGDATFSAADIRLALAEAGGDIGALKTNNLTLDGHVTLEDHASLGADGTLALIGGNVMGNGESISNLLLTAVNELQLDGNVGGADLELGSVSLASGDVMRLLGGPSGSNDNDQRFHIQGDLTVGSLVQGPSQPLSLIATDGVYVDVTGDVYISVADSGAIDAQFNDGLNIHAGGIFETGCDISTNGDLSIQAATLISENNLSSVEGALTLIADGTQPGQGTLSLGGTLSAATNLTLASEATLTTNQALSAAGNISLESFANDVVVVTTINAGADVHLSAGQGRVTMNDQVTGQHVSVNAGEIELANSGVVSGQNSVNMAAGNDVMLSGTVSATNVTVSGGAVQVDGMVSGGTIDVAGDSIMTGSSSQVDGSAAVMMTAN